jgi:cell division protein ZapA
MGQVTATVNGRSYTLSCGDGEEPRLRELLALVRERTDSLTAAHGIIPDARILLMAAVLIADDLLDTRAKLKALEANSGVRDGGDSESARALKQRRDKAG